MPTIPQTYRKPGQKIGDPTLLQKLDLFPAVTSLVGTIFWQMANGAFRGDKGTKTFKHHVTHAVIRKLGTRFSTSQVQYLAPPFRKEYEHYCKTHSQEPNIVTLKSGIEAFWTGSPQAKNVIIYFHGGGFSMDAGGEHLKFWGDNVAKDINSAQSANIAFLFVAYTVVPYATYPTQIQEAAEALDYVLTDLKRSPSDVSLGGDSAGGNMCLAVLSHLLHPHPDMVQIKLNEPLKTLILVAPWTSFRLDWPSTKANAHKDIISSFAENLWAKDYMAGEPSTPYAEPLNVDADWWRGAEQKVTRVICVAGSDELLIDPISAWVEKYTSETADGHLEFVVGEHESHIAPIIEPMLGDHSATQQGEAIKGFIRRTTL